MRMRVPVEEVLILAVVGEKAGPRQQNWPHVMPVEDHPVPDPRSQRGVGHAHETDIAALIFAASNPGRVTTACIGTGRVPEVDAVVDVEGANRDFQALILVFRVVHGKGPFATVSLADMTTTLKVPQ
jgi:hypothetical protein